MLLFHVTFMQPSHDGTNSSLHSLSIAVLPIPESKKSKVLSSFTCKSCCGHRVRAQNFRGRRYAPVQVGGLRVVDVLALFSYGGRVLRPPLAVAGSQRVVVALRLDGAHGQGHVVRPVRAPAGLCLRPGVGLVRHGPGASAASCRGGQVGHLDVGDAGLPQDQLRMRQLQLLHVVDGYGGVEGLLGSKRKEQNGKENYQPLLSMLICEDT